jgi:carbonic anhydrase
LSSCGATTCGVIICGATACGGATALNAVAGRDMITISNIVIALYINLLNLFCICESASILFYNLWFLTSKVSVKHQLLSLKNFDESVENTS